MYICYIDESGTPDIPGNTSHFVLAGLAMPIWHWRDADREIAQILTKYGLAEHEFHSAWIARTYLEQRKVPGFDGMNWATRRAEATKIRTAELLRLQHLQLSGPYKQEKKTYRHSEPYIHLTLAERRALMTEVAQAVSQWGFARLFAEIVDKIQFDPQRQRRTVTEQAFEQVVTRFQRFLVNIQEGPQRKSYGLLVHDNNESVAKKHTALMRQFHAQGTLWNAAIDNIIETPMFVDSSLTRMVQIADLCSFALRRYAENREVDLFRLIFQRGDRAGNAVVGIRHFTTPNACDCEVCKAHSLPATPTASEPSLPGIV